MVMLSARQLTGLCIVTLFVSPLFANNWEPMHAADLPSANGEKFYETFMDRSTLRKEGKLRSLWILVNYPNSRSYRATKNGEVVFVKFFSMKAQDYFDCENRAIAVAREDFYSNEMGSGKLLRSAVYSKSVQSLKWERANLSETVSSRLKIVCDM
jgi:hypothetical protein